MTERETEGDRGRYRETETEREGHRVLSGLLAEDLSRERELSGLIAEDLLSKERPPLQRETLSISRRPPLQRERALRSFSGSSQKFYKMCNLLIYRKSLSSSATETGDESVQKVFLLGVKTLSSL